jgi:hypothetical protein
LSNGCFSECDMLSRVRFESGSKVTCFMAHAFSYCSSLSSICIRSSVTELGNSCFAGCLSLSALTWDSGSHLSCIEHKINPLHLIRSLHLMRSIPKSISLTSISTSPIQSSIQSINQSESRRTISGWALGVNWNTR